MNIDHATHEQLERSLGEVDLAALRRQKYKPSPAAWEDQVLYFLMLDRFSDGNEQGYRDNSGSPVLTGNCVTGAPPIFNISGIGFRCQLRYSARTEHV